LPIVSSLPFASYEDIHYSVSEQPREAGVGYQRDNVKGNQPLLDQRQGVEHVASLVGVRAFEYQHGSGAILPKVEFAEHASLMEFPNPGGLGLQVRLECGVRDAGDVFLKLS
jgi:hypothetical protein